MSFKKWRQAHDEMENDTAVWYLRDLIERAQEYLSRVESPYRARMATAELEIEKAVLGQGESVTLYGVYARYTKESKRTSWKPVAQAMKPPQSLIDEHTKTSPPSVRVSAVKDYDPNPSDDPGPSFVGGGS